MLDSPALVAALAMFFGMVGQGIARHLAMPGIVLLLALGIGLGPDALNLIRPDALGSGLETLVGFAVAIILFEGGLNMKLRVLRRQSRPIRRLIGAGALITAVGATLAPWLILGWDLRLSLLFGTLVIVTGPTVITPLLRRVHARASLETILEAEGIFVDAIGATVAVVALEVVLSPPGTRLTHAALGIGQRLGVGTVLGLVGGAVLAGLLRIRWALPDGLANVTSLASAVLIYQISNSLVPESGIIAVILAGMVVGNVGSHALESLREFKEQLTILLVAMLFVLLSASVRVADVLALGWRGMLVVLALVFVVRPLCVFGSMVGTEVDVRGRLFLAWLAPRGIVAAAVSALFAERLDAAGIPGGTEVRALVFMVIAVTVVVQGLTAGPVASLLRVRLPRDVGYAILGGHEVARALAKELGADGEEVVLIDTSSDAVRAIEKAGLRAIFGDGLDDSTLLKARVETRRACVAFTPNESVNLLFAKHVSARNTRVRTYVAIEHNGKGITQAMVDAAHGVVLDTGARTVASWAAALGRDRARVRRLVCERDAAFPLETDRVLLLALRRDGATRPVPYHYAPAAKDQLAVIMSTESESEDLAQLATAGWYPA